MSIVVNSVPPKQEKYEGINAEVLVINLAEEGRDLTEDILTDIVLKEPVLNYKQQKQPVQDDQTGWLLSPLV